MAKIVRYPGNLKAFAADALGTERTIFGDTAQADDLASNITADFLRGWGIVGVNENPTKQDFNGLAFTLGQLIAYLHQMGVSEWDDEQEYAQYGLCIGSDGRLYQSLVAANIGNDPTTDGGTNWRDYKTSIDSLASGSATFTNIDNNISLTGIGSNVEIGDVIQVDGSVSNDTEFTVEVVTDANNVIVNQAHAGGTTTKSLTDETATVTVKLLAKWYLAPIGLGQGWADVSSLRSISTSYTNNTNREILISPRPQLPDGNVDKIRIVAGGVRINEIFVDSLSLLSDVNYAVLTNISAGISYSVDSVDSHIVANSWLEYR